MHKPIVSVIIPCYNSEATISETLESLQKQIFSDWEAIVVNDGSADHSAEIIHKYQSKDPRIKQIDQDNQGLPAARNAGLGVAIGEFVNFLDADDLLMPNMLQNMVHKLKNYTSLGAAYCGWINSDAKVRDLNWVVTPQYEGQLFDKLVHHNRFPCHSILIRREILENTGIFDCSLFTCEDWDLWIRVARAGSCFGCVSTPLVIYRMVPGSMSRTPFAFFKAGKEVIRRGHNPDHRVKIPASKFAQGCNCPMKEVILEWCIHCVGSAIGIGEAVQASQLFETYLEEGDFHITPKMMGNMRYALWLPAAVPPGNWDVLWSTIGTALLQFLIREEEYLGMRGFAMRTLMEIAVWHKPMSGRELVSKLGKRLVHRVFRL